MPLQLTARKWFVIVFFMFRSTMNLNLKKLSISAFFSNVSLKYMTLMHFKEPQKVHLTIIKNKVDTKGSIYKVTPSH